MSIHIDCIDLGLCDYKEAWDFQKKRFESLTHQKKEDSGQNALISNCLVLCSHPNVYTIGKSGNDQHILLSQNELEERNIAFYRNDRGGDVTYHGPGQLVAYPILDLEFFKKDIGWYVRNLEEVVINLLAEYELDGTRISGASGVWLKGKKNSVDRKICALGVKTSRWITMHGIALNVNTDLSYFNNIIPCGLHNTGVTSMQIELAKELDMEKVKSDFIENFKTVFGVTYN